MNCKKNKKMQTQIFCENWFKESLSKKHIFNYLEDLLNTKTDLLFELIWRIIEQETSENATCIYENKAPGLFLTFPCMIMDDFLRMQKQIFERCFQESSSKKHVSWYRFGKFPQLKMQLVWMNIKLQDCFTCIITWIGC